MTGQTGVKPGSDRGQTGVRPPAAADWLLTRALRSRDEREMVLGDLHEQLPRHGAAWYWRQAIAIAAHATLRRPPAAAPSRSSGDFVMRIFLNDVKYAWRALVPGERARCLRCGSRRDRKSVV